MEGRCEMYQFDSRNLFVPFWSVGLHEAKIPFASLLQKEIGTD